jgi:hypothetical protein
LNYSLRGDLYLLLLLFINTIINLEKILIIES